MTEEETTREQHIWVLCGEQQYDGPTMWWATFDVDVAYQYVREHVQDIEDWIEWDDGGGIIWDSDERVDGYSIRRLEVRG